MHQQGQKRQKWKIWQKWKASKQDTEDTRLSIKLHLTVWNNFYSYTNASSDKVKQVKEIYGQDESKNVKK